MKCSTCGNDLAESARFCTTCGTPNAPDAKEMDELMQEASNLIGENDKKEAPAKQEPVTASNPVPPKKKKGGRKVWKILIPILAVLLLAGAAFGFYMWAEDTYEKANACLAEKEYEQALELYSKFSFYKDCKEQIESLTLQQETYDNAIALLDMNEYAKALEMFRALGDYRNSQELYLARVPYQRAQYLMSSAAAGDASAVPQHPAYADGAANENTAIFLYEGAAEIFRSLGDHEDSLVLSSQCYLEIAYIYIEQGMFEEALGCQSFMNESDNELMLAEYMTHCADESALADLTAAVLARLEKEATFQTDAEMTHKDLVDAELAILEGYSEDLMYYDQDLKARMAAYLDALKAESACIGENGFCTDIPAWYTANAARLAVIEELIANHEFLAEEAETQASFEGLSAKFTAFAVIEKELPNQIAEDLAEKNDEYGDHYVFENTTGYTFTLSVSHSYYDEEGELVLLNETDAIEIGAGETVYISFLTPTDEDWESVQISWTYDVTIA